MVRSYAHTKINREKILENCKSALTCSVSVDRLGLQPRVEHMSVGVLQFDDHRLRIITSTIVSGFQLHVLYLDSTPEVMILHKNLLKLQGRVWNLKNH